MVPPSTMPDTATRVRTDRVRVGIPTMMPMATVAPAAQASTTERVAWAWPRRRCAAVPVATVNMTATTTAAVGGANTPRSAAATRASCATARTAATSTARRCPAPASVNTARVMASRSASPMPNRSEALTASSCQRRLTTP